ncbi:methyltransferase domain-containing protein [Solimonas variicoloris]|uniref:methyltransferase domain-containing protein n=1 Tax=Solimonas variicoloris TaxID=254408 RepID=UPI000381EC01|nr:methyltransferase domain-containing protein [Solimonas variicoloris]
MSGAGLQALDERRAARRFSAAAARYEQAARLQAQTRAQLLALLTPYVPVRCVVDLGCGSGPALPALRARYPDAALVALDRAAGMVAQARGRDAAQGLIADAQALPLATASVDLLFSNLALQWCSRRQAALDEAARVLAPGGLLALAVPGPATLRELRLAWQQIDAAEHVHSFAAPEVWLDAAAASGLAVRADVRRLYQPQHPDVRALMQELRDIGARNASPARRRHWLGKSALARLEQAYAPWRCDGGVYASWEILYLVLQKP